MFVNIYKKSSVDKKSLFVVKEAYDLGFFDVPKRINLHGYQLYSTLKYTVLIYNHHIHFLSQGTYCCTDGFLT